MRGQSEVRAEAVVVGGGLAGAAAAISLARAGRDVVLVEREAAAQHKVCGEFLSAEALGYLRALGVDVAGLGAVAISVVRLAGVERRLPFEAMSMTRKRLDEELLQVAAGAGVRVVRGCAVEGMERAGEGWRVRAGAGERATAKSDAEGAKGAKFTQSEGEGGVRSCVQIDAAAVFLATGKHDLRGWQRPAGKQDGLVGLKMYWKLAPEQEAALAGCVELMTYRGGYAGLQPVEEGAANLCGVVERAELQRLGGRWEKFLAALLAQSEPLRRRLEGAEALLEKPLAVAAIPYGLVREPVAGVWCLGDQAAVIPSFTGDGMSIALHTGMLAAKMYLDGQAAGSFQRRVKVELSRQVRLATWVSQGLVRWPKAMATAARMWPGILEVVAAGTRISKTARADG